MKVSGEGEAISGNPYLLENDVVLYNIGEYDGKPVGVDIEMHPDCEGGVMRVYKRNYPRRGRSKGAGDKDEEGGEVRRCDERIESH